MNAKLDFDVLVVGASLSGAAFAIKLARAGMRVGLIDKAIFPRRKPCGEGLGFIAVQALSRLGVLTELTALPHAPLYGVRIWGGACPVDIDFFYQRNNEAGMGVQRLVLDDFLLRVAQREANITLLLGTKIKEVHRAAQGFELSTNADSFRANYLALADGVNSVLAPQLGSLRRMSGRRRFGYSFVLEGDFAAPLERAQVILRRSLEVYCTKVADNRLTVCLLTEGKNIVQATSKHAVNKILEDVFAVTNFRGEICQKGQGAGPVGGGPRANLPSDVFLLGDACESLDPIAGMGMSHAFVCAELAAEELIAVRQGSKNLLGAAASYYRRREKQALMLRGFTNLTYHTLTTVGTTRLFRILGKSSLANRINQVAHRSEAPQNATTMLAKALVCAAGKL